MSQGQAPAPRPRVVFILSTNYAGSHLLAQLLAAHSACAGVGELHNYEKFRGRGSRSGNVVNDYLTHPVFAGLAEVPVARWHPLLFERLRAGQPTLSHLVDNSKRPEWARRFPPETAHYVHLIRDPRALVSRWLRTYDTAQAHGAQRRRVRRQRPWLALRKLDPLDVYVQKWLLANQRISRFTARHSGIGPISYRDLALQPAATLGSLMPALGLEYQSRQIDYGAQDSALGTRKRDYLDTNRQSRIELDLRWQAQLTASQRQRIEASAAIRRYLIRVGLALVDDGLTARPPA